MASHCCGTAASSTSMTNQIIHKHSKLVSDLSKVVNYIFSTALTSSEPKPKSSFEHSKCSRADATSTYHQQNIRELRYFTGAHFRNKIERDSYYYDNYVWQSTNLLQKLKSSREYFIHFKFFCKNLFVQNVQTLNYFYMSHLDNKDFIAVDRRTKLFAIIYL